MYKFKAHLKSEIEVFVANIFLKVLESPNSSFEQKAIMLEALRALCSDPGLLTQIFLNYDCDEDASNLYDEIVVNLTKLANKATKPPAKNTPKQDIDNEFELSLAGVEVLTAILRAFLKALGLPFTEADDSEDSAATRLRKHLQIDVGLAASVVTKKKVSADTSLHDSVVTDDASTTSSAKDLNLSTSQGEIASVDSADDLAGKIVTSFEQKRTNERNFELGCVKLTLSVKQGLNYFIDNGFVKLDARDVAQFFLKGKDKLDKTQLGEFLGREPDAAFVKGNDIDPEKGGKGFYVRVLHHYVDLMDFTGIQFDDAIRLFLSGFRLPGEAQKVSAAVLYFNSFVVFTL